jgi:cysteine-rich secretory family protein
MKAFLKPLGILSIAFAVGFMAAGFTFTRLNADGLPPNETEDPLQQLAELTNAERVARGLSPLKLQNNLREAAVWLARDMAEHSYLGHRDSGGRDMSTRLEGFGYANASAVAENVAVGPTTSREALDQWMKSDEHRSNILSPALREIGVGYAETTGWQSRRYWVQDFGSRFRTYAIVINKEAARTSDPRVELSISGCDKMKSATHACPSHMRLSNNGMTWTAWEGYAPRRMWTLTPGTGGRQVVVELRVGSDTYRAKDTIELSPPTPAATNLATFKKR